LLALGSAGAGAGAGTGGEYFMACLEAMRPPLRSFAGEAAVVVVNDSRYCFCHETAGGWVVAGAGVGC
jgi:hypothetical protein